MNIAPVLISFFFLICLYACAQVQNDGARSLHNANTVISPTARKLWTGTPHEQQSQQTAEEKRILQDGFSEIQILEMELVCVVILKPLLMMMELNMKFKLSTFLLQNIIQAVNVYGQKKLVEKLIKTSQETLILIRLAIATLQAI